MNRKNLVLVFFFLAHSVSMMTSSWAMEDIHEQAATLLHLSGNLQGSVLEKEQRFSFHVNFREPAAIFTLMDNVSCGETIGCFNKEYRSYWEEQFSPSPAEHELFEQYKIIRLRSYCGKDHEDTRTLSDLFCSDSTEEVEGGIFSMPNPKDCLAEAFYSASTLEEAYADLEGILEPSEVGFLKRFYGIFSPYYSALINDCYRFTPIIQEEKTTLSSPDLLNYLKEVANFYRVHESIVFNVLHTWYPPSDMSAGFCYNNYLILKDNPSDLQGKIDIVLHEAIHAISACQADSQKRSLTKTFMTALPSESPKTSLLERVEKNILQILEEPLAVVFGQMLYLYRFHPEKYEEDNTQNTWYMDEWVNEYANIIFPFIKESLENKRTLDEDLVKRLATLTVGVPLP